MIETDQTLTGNIQSNELTGSLDFKIVEKISVEDVKVNGTSVVENNIANIAVPTKVSDLNNDAGYTSNIGTITSLRMNGNTISSSGEADLGTVITDVSGKQDVLVSGTNIKTINDTSILGSGNITIEGGGSSKYNIIGDYLIYNVSGGNYNITPNSTSNITKTRLPLTELTEAIELAYNNDKYLILNIYTSGNGTYVEYIYSTKFLKTSSAQNTGMAVYNNFPSGNLWSANLILNYGFSSGEWYCNNPICRGETQKTVGMNNDNVYTPSNPYNVCTKKYVDDAISSAITDALGGNY